jgi:triosephosphate isomerase
MERKPLVAANWKMQLSHKGEIEAMKGLKKLLLNSSLNIDVVVCPSYPSLPALSTLVAKSGKIQLGAQNVHWQDKGAFTGEVSVNQIAPFVKWSIVGHSEQRALTGMTDEHVLQQAQILLSHSITPIACIGETAEERESNMTVSKVTTQARTIFQGLTLTSLSKLVIAYEPIWAVGTDVQPSSDEVSGIMLLIRKLAAEQFDNEAAERLRIIYGGSVDSHDVKSYMSEPGVDGVLVGGASVRPIEFFNIIKIANEL